MTDKIDTAIGTLPVWAAYIYDECFDPAVEPIAGWLRIIDPDGYVEIVPARYVKGRLRPMDPPPTSVHATREAAEKAVRHALAARWWRDLPEHLGWVAKLPAADRVPSQLRDLLGWWDRQAAAATDHRTAYDALVRGGCLTSGRDESTRQVPRVGGGGMEVVTTPAEPCELTAAGRELAARAQEEK